jgi:LacI family transcriptional regulator
MIKILLLTDFSSGYGRQLLQGVVEYSKKFGPWFFYRMPIYYRELYGDKGVVDWAKKWRADAIIAQLGDVDMEVLNQLDIPVIVQNYKDRFKNISNLTGDYYYTGAMAADFFKRKGFKNFAYYAPTDTVWMRERGEGFRQKVVENGGNVYVYEEQAGIEQEKWSFNVKAVSSWLLDLPKPVALFACDDYFALQITEVCKMYNIDIPYDISILGVDNDELLCSISDPNLSSIELDVINGGYEVGKLIHLFINKKMEPPVDVVIKPVRIVERKSTKKYVVNNKYIEKLLDYIENNYMNPLSVGELASVVPYSRRVLEKRFKEEIGITIYQYLLRVRTDKFSELLITSDLSLVEAAYYAGFSDYKNVSRVFAKEKNMTPFQFRKMQK